MPKRADEAYVLTADPWLEEGSGRRIFEDQVVPNCQQTRGAQEIFRSSNNAFTLVELLVVIAIIAILASLLLSALAGAKWRADLAVCRSNLRQLGIALNNYTTDFNAYPSGTSASGEFLSWPLVAEKYTGAPFPRQNYFQGQDGSTKVTNWVRSVFACPGYNRMPGLYRPSRDAPVIAYGYNAWGAVCNTGMPPIQYREKVLGLAGLYDDSSQNRRCRTVKESEVIAPSDMIAFADANLFALPMVNAMGSFDPSHSFEGSKPFEYAAGNPWAFCGDDLALLSASPMPTFEAWKPSDYRLGHAFFGRRHGGLWNTVFCDGHVESLRAMQLHQGSPSVGWNAAVWRRWNLDNLPHELGQHELLGGP